ncbi:MAG: glycosyltransferase [Spirochaetota bacterium]|nr:glycosyltransferase [Spirochaetota bacterium]
MGFYEYLVITLYIINTFLMFVYGFHYYLIAFLYHRKKKRDPQPVWAGDWPQVTVQLPIFNELYVAERLIRQVMKLDYPRELLEVQILDDSTDETIEIAKSLVDEYQALGFQISHIHRVDRVDHKAGALRHGLVTASGDYIAI